MNDLDAVSVLGARKRAAEVEAEGLRLLYVEAIKIALDAGCSRDEVCAAAGVSPQALYRSLRGVYGPRRQRKETPTV